MASMTSPVQAPGLANTSVPTFPNYTIVFDFEKQFDLVKWQVWMEKNWQIPICANIAYVTVIFGLQRFMASRKAFELKHPLLVWNTLLAILSVFCSIRFLPELWRAFREYGFNSIVCDNRLTIMNPVSSFWCWIFTMAKLVELGDTLFIVLRKRQLIFLHWYHHVTVLILSWYTFVDAASTMQVYGPVNAAVHSVMYTYFALQVLKVKIPRVVSMSITISQIIQMVVGSYVTWWAFTVKRNGIAVCNVSDKTLYIAEVIYISYLILFVKFFYVAYMTPSKKSKKIE